MIPDGYVLVPIEPTEEMKVEGRDHLPATPGGVSPKTAGNVYEAMINAAPQPPNQLNTTPVGEAVAEVIHDAIGIRLGWTHSKHRNLPHGTKLFNAPIHTAITRERLDRLYMEACRTVSEGQPVLERLYDLLIAELNPKTAGKNDV